MEKYFLLSLPLYPLSRYCCLRDTGLYYLQSRYYDPAIGRFINADSYASTGQGFLGCNMFVYCLNNPINLTDRCGHNAASIASEWAATMWWLFAVDGPLPIGELIYFAGWGLAFIGAIIVTDYAASNHGSASPNTKQASDSKKHEEQTQQVAGYGSSAAPPPQDPKNNKQDLEYKDEKYLERELKKQNTDPHSIKKEYLGNKAEISKFDLYVDKGTGRLAIVRKMTGQVIEYTNYYIS